MADSGVPGLNRAFGLRVERYGADGHPDYPVVKILIDGQETLAADGRIRYMGFSPGEILGADSPLLPSDPPRRVAVYGCCCGITGCGCVAPLITQQGDQVTWSDFRDFTAVYDGPATVASPSGGRPLPFPDLVFDARQYRTEIERASADRSWETEDWQAASFLRRILEQNRVHLHALGWLFDGLAATYRPGQFDVWLTDNRHVQQVRVRLTTEEGTPADRARLMADVLLYTQPEQWPVTRRHSLVPLDSATPDGNPEADDQDGHRSPPTGDRS